MCASTAITPPYNWPTILLECLPSDALRPLFPLPLSTSLETYFFVYFFSLKFKRNLFSAFFNALKWKKCSLGEILENKLNIGNARI